MTSMETLSKCQWDYLIIHSINFPFELLETYCYKKYRNSVFTRNNDTGGPKI